MSQQKAKVLYNYSAQNADELNLKVGDVVIIHEIFDDHWIRGELNGIIGMFPENYVQIFDTPGSTGLANSNVVSSVAPGGVAGKDRLPENHVIALVDSEGNQSGQLAFKRGDVIKVLERFPTGWLRGECNGKVGVLKKEFVSEDPSAVGSGGGGSGNTQSNSGGGTKGKVIYAFQANYSTQISLEVGQEVIIYEEVQQGWMRGECNGKVGIFPGSFVQKFESSPSNDSQSHSQLSPSLPLPTQSQLSASQQQGNEAVAIHPYKANGAGQLSFETGDTIIVTAKLQAGWWSGKHAATGETGIFPGAFVKDKSETANNPAQSNSSFKVRVLHDYQPAGPNQLALKIGQIITVTRELPRGWWFGEIDGVSGAFPASFTKKLDDVSNAPSTNISSVTKTLVIANYDFSGGEGKLSFTKGEKFYLIKELEKGWSNGEKDGKIGLFPTSYVAAAPVEQVTDQNTAQSSYPSHDQVSSNISNHDQSELKPNLPPPAAVSSNRGRPNPQQELPKSDISTLPKPLPKPEAQSVPPQPLPKPEAQSVLPQPLPKPEVQVTPQPPKPETQSVTPQPPPKPEGQVGSGPVPPPPPSGVPVPPKLNQEPPKKIPSAKNEPVATKVEKPSPAPAIVFDNELEKKIAERARKMAEQENTNKSVPEKPVNEKPIQTTEINQFKKQEKVEESAPTTNLNTTSNLPVHRNSGSRTPGTGTTPRNNPVRTTPAPAQNIVQTTTSPVDQEELSKYKTALTRLQSQTKVAIDQMMEIIGKQNKDYLKVVSVIREMKLEIIEEQKKTQQLGEQNRKLYTDLTTLQKYHNESRGSALPSKQGVSSIQEELEIERQRRHDLESHVNKLQTELENLQRRLGRLENQGFI